MKTLDEIIAAPKPPIKNSFSHFDQKLLLQIDPYDRSPELINVIVKKNQKLVHSVATVLWRYCPQSAKSVLEYEDLVSAGQFGLIRASSLYDRRFNAEFATYAMYWIRQTIMREIENNFCMVKIPVHFIVKMKKVRHGEECDQRTVLAVNTAERLFLGALSLDTYVLEGESTTLGELLPNSASMNRSRFLGYNDPEALALLSDLRNRIEESITYLGNTRKIGLLKMRFGINEHNETHTLEEVGSAHGITRERVRQISAKYQERVQKKKAFDAEDLDIFRG